MKTLIFGLLLLSGCGPKIGDCILIVDGPFAGRHGYMDYKTNSYIYIRTKEHSIIMTEIALADVIPNSYCEEFQ